jgi:hypothetical protein
LGAKRDSIGFSYSAKNATPYMYDFAAGVTVGRDFTPVPSSCESNGGDGMRLGCRAARVSVGHGY